MISTTSCTVGTAAMDKEDVSPLGDVINIK